MSLEFSVKISKNTIKEEDLLFEVKKHYRDAMLECGENENIVEVNNIYEHMGFVLTIIKEKKPPYNIYDSEFLKREYEYTQVINIEFDKQNELSNCYKTAIEIVCSVILRSKAEALIISDFSEDICFIDITGVISANRNVAFINEQIFDKMFGVKVSFI